MSIDLWTCGCTVRRAASRLPPRRSVPVLMLALAMSAQAAPCQAQGAVPSTVQSANQAPASVMQSAPATADAATSRPAAAATAAPQAQSRSAQLPHELSVVGMFLSADTVVKAVMIGLMLSSVAVWAVWMAKLVELWTGRRRLRAARAALAEERSLAHISGATAATSPIVAALVAAAGTEMRLSSDTVDREGLKTRIASRLAEVAASASRRAHFGTGLLASVGATAPFIGLFGTVWGIMNSFIGISKSQTTNLAVVAPGIAEALLATAIGLVAAIPAVLFYNQLARGIASYKALLGAVAAEVERIVSRDLDRASSGPHHLRAARAAE